MAGKIVCIDLGGTKALCGVACQGVVSNVARYPVPADASKQEVTHFLIELISHTLSDECDGIAIGIPGVVDSDLGYVFEVTNIPSWRNIYLSHILQKRFNVPVLVHNDVNCFAYGEYKYGAHFDRGRPCHTILGVCLGTGLGAGVVIDGKIYTGRQGLAGEFGSAPYLQRTIEDYCSGQFFRNLGTDGEREYALAVAGDKRALDLFAQLGNHLGVAIAHMQLAYDPDVIVLGGSVSNSYHLFESAMRTRFAQYEQGEHVAINISSLSHSPLIGACELFYQRYGAEVVRSELV
ncbi:ROK family protein [Pseudoalteromonas sp. SMS1]|uniref:ROK family protein n=1 Tax=Pseudoalteromonas sp. SMS1 TaxID=2908894 RepID=UPI001F268091|nr:ROK family protein [Pseudoalteromonas sp. SMS1]MCF2857679.1 ROK family protein [Pseudoalteromonas sp. SMS1]